MVKANHALSNSALVVNCCQTMNYALLKFLDVNRVNVFAIYLYTVKAFSFAAFLASVI